MGKRQWTFYEGLIFGANAYFMVIGLASFVLRLIFGGFFTYWAFSMLVVFAAQLYYKNRMINLISGILMLAASIFFSLEFMSMGYQSGFNIFIGGIAAVAIVGILLSGALIFSYTRLSFMNN